MGAMEFTLKEGVTTRMLNKAIRTRVYQALKEFEDRAPKGVTATHERRRPKSGTHYVFGIGIPELRDTLVASHDAGSDKVLLVFPNNYQGWDRSDAYTQLRVRIWDLILHHEKLINPLGPSRDLSNPS